VVRGKTFDRRRGFGCVVGARAACRQSPDGGAVSWGLGDTRGVEDSGVGTPVWMVIQVCTQSSPPGGLPCPSAHLPCRLSFLTRMTACLASMRTCKPRRSGCTSLAEGGCPAESARVCATNRGGRGSGVGGDTLVWSGAVVEGEPALTADRSLRKVIGEAAQFQDTVPLDVRHPLVQPVAVSFGQHLGELANLGYRRGDRGGDR